MNMMSHAMNEFKAAGWVDENGKYTDEMQEQMCQDVLAILDVISDQGHSGFSFNYLMGILTRVAKFKPLTPLTGEDDEWDDVSERMGSPTWQNKRCSSVFKDATGKARFSEAVVFRGKDGVCYTSRDSSKEITFPFTVPDKPEYVDVDE